MQLQVMLLSALPAHAAHHWALASSSARPTVALASLGIPDTLAIFVVALVVFGPKRLPEIGKQIGKLVFEFRRASNDFKLQIEEELRMAEQQDREKGVDMQAAANQPATPVALSAESTTSAVSSESQPASGFESMMKDTEPQPPDRRPGIAEAISTSTPEVSSVPPEPSTAAPITGQSAPLTIQPPSSGTPVSALPPNHAARNVMTALPPAGAPLETTEADVSAEAIHADTTAHNG